MPRAVGLTFKCIQEAQVVLYMIHIEDTFWINTVTAGAHITGMCVAVAWALGVTALIPHVFSICILSRMSLPENSQWQHSPCTLPPKVNSSASSRPLPAYRQADNGMYVGCMPQVLSLTATPMIQNKWA